MIKRILQDAGFIENRTFRKSRFLSPPNEAYAVYFDEIASAGSDTDTLLYRHTATIELYSYTAEANAAAENRLDKTLSVYYPDMIDGYQKQAVYWIEAEQLYQTVYEFEYFTKGVNN